MAGYLKRLSDWQRDVTMKMMGVKQPEKPEEKPMPKKKKKPKGGLLDPANRGGGMNRELMERK